MAVLQDQHPANLLLLVVGVGLLGASVFAEVIGLGDDPGFGSQQTMGPITGAADHGCGGLLAPAIRAPAVGTRSDTLPTLAEARRFYLDLPVGTEPDTASVAGAGGGLEERSSESATTRVSNPRQ